MKKPANELKKGDKIKLANKSFVIKEFELSDIGKHGKRKCRIEAESEQGEKITVIRPEDYPIETEK
jgi:translation elongation factor P/translation initiation factor 5A